MKAYKGKQLKLVKQIVVGNYASSTLCKQQTASSKPRVCFETTSVFAIKLMGA